MKVRQPKCYRYYEDIDYTPDIVTRGGRLSREFITWVSDGEEEFILVPDIPETDEEINLFLNSYRKEKD